jgi:hypothetical protein
MSIKWVRQPTYDPDTHRKVQAGSLSCNCGATVVLALNDDCECHHCGTEFNQFGQQLAPREMWEG